MALDEIIKRTWTVADKVALFNNADQVFNHTFYWHSMKPMEDSKLDSIHRCCYGKITISGLKPGAVKKIIIQSFYHDKSVS